MQQNAYAITQAATAPSTQQPASSMTTPYATTPMTYAQVAMQRPAVW